MPNLSTYHEARQLLLALRQAAPPTGDHALQRAAAILDGNADTILAGLSQAEFAAIAAETQPPALTSG